MMRVVRAADKRTWTVHSRISWTKPELAEQFEHDMAAGYVSCVAMLGVVVALTLFVVFWTPAGVVIPAWFVLLILLVLLVLLMSWAMQRPWVITARTAEPIETEGERWEGLVRGMVPAREETYRIADALKERSIPNDGHGPLSRVPSPTAPMADS
jgi:hypothetical protein